MDFIYDQGKTCFNCRFYDYVNLCCMYDGKCTAILFESESAKDCEQFSEGKFDWKELEKSGYR